MKIEFYSVVEGVELTYPPIPISQVDMRWIKKSQEWLRNQLQNNKNVAVTHATHLCSGIRNLTSMGYAITAWHDIELTTNGDGYQYNWVVPHTNYRDLGLGPDPITSFPAEIYGEHAVLPPQTLKTIIKIPTPWRVKMPKGWGLMFLPMHYADENRFTSLVGILDPEIESCLHAVLYWHRLNETVAIKAGTPLFYVVPVKLDEKIDVVIRSATEKEQRWETVRKNVHNTVFMNGIAKVKRAYEQFWHNDKRN